MVAILERFGPSGEHDSMILDEASKRISMGRNPQNDLVIENDAAVSSTHAVLERLGAAWCIEDLKSKNGTYVDKERIFGRSALKNRNEIGVGRTRLVFRDVWARDDETTAPMRPAPDRTAAEQRVLIELCRPVLSGRSFTMPASVQAIADSLFVIKNTVQFHLENLYRKFGIEHANGDRRVLLANEAIERGAVARKDLETEGPLEG